MKRISILSPLLLALPLSFAACDVDKDDGAETGAASGDDENDDDVDDGDDDEPDQGGSSSAGSGEDPTDADDEPLLSDDLLAESTLIDSAFGAGYLDGDYQVETPGTFVRCAVTGAAIPLEELKYWSVEHQEAYVDAAASLKRYKGA